MKTMMTIAGSDSSGGAGIQADIKTATALGVFATSAITAITAQNTTGVSAILDIPQDILAAQIDAILTDISPDAIKIGMVSSPESINTIAERLQDKKVPIVLDPVMVATSGARLLQKAAEENLQRHLIPLATIITPNLPEAEILADMTIRREAEQIEAAKKLYETFGVFVLVKGGHGLGAAIDILYDGEVHRFEKPMLNNPNTHGTGCTLSSAIASFLAKGLSIKEAVKEAKDYVYDAIADGINLGRARGPINHMVRSK